MQQRLVIVVDEDVEDECGCEVIESKCERSLSLQSGLDNGNVGRLLVRKWIYESRSEQEDHKGSDALHYDK